MGFWNAWCAKALRVHQSARRAGATWECRGVTSETLNIAFNMTAHATRRGLVRTCLFSSSSWRGSSRVCGNRRRYHLRVEEALKVRGCGGEWEEEKRCEGSQRGQTATIASCKSCIIVIYTTHQPMLIITQRHASTTMKWVYERTTVEFTSFADEEPEGVRLYSLSNIPFFSFCSYLSFLFSLLPPLSLSLSLSFSLPFSSYLSTSLFAGVTQYLADSPNSPRKRNERLSELFQPAWVHRWINYEILSCRIPSWDCHLTCMYAARMGYLATYTVWVMSEWMQFYSFLITLRGIEDSLGINSP